MFTCVPLCWTALGFAVLQSVKDGRRQPVGVSTAPSRRRRRNLPQTRACLSFCNCYTPVRAEVLKVTDDSLSAFPRVWRQADAAPNSAQLAQEDIVKAAPTSKKLGAYPSERITSVRFNKMQR